MSSSARGWLHRQAAQEARQWADEHSPLWAAHLPFKGLMEHCSSCGPNLRLETHCTSFLTLRRCSQNSPPHRDEGTAPKIEKSIAQFMLQCFRTDGRGSWCRIKTF